MGCSWRNSFLSSSTQSTEIGALNWELGKEITSKSIKETEFLLSVHSRKFTDGLLGDLGISLPGLWSPLILQPLNLHFSTLCLAPFMWYGVQVRANSSRQRLHSDIRPGSEDMEQTINKL